MITNLSEFDAQIGTYEDIINSGNLNLIQDFSLRSSIIEGHMELKSISFLDEYFKEYFRDHVTAFVFTDLDLLTGSFVDDEIRFSTRFSNIYLGYYSMVQQRYEAYKAVRIVCESMRQNLERCSED